MSARELCSSISAIQAKLTPLIPTLLAQSANQDAFIVNVLTAANLKPAQIEAFRSTLKRSATSSSVDATSIIQSNTFDTNTCSELLGCKNIRDPVYKATLTKLLGSAQAAQTQIDMLQQMCTFRASQSNVSGVQQSAQQMTTGAISALTAQPFDPTVQGIINALTGGAPLNCLLFPTKSTSVDLATAYSTCSNHAEINMANVAKCSSANQSNSANLLQSCVTKTAIGGTATTNPTAAVNASTTYNNPGSKTAQHTTEETGTAKVLLISAVIIIACVTLYRLA